MGEIEGFYLEKIKKRINELILKITQPSNWLKLEGCRD